VDVLRYGRDMDLGVWMSQWTNGVAVEDEWMSLLRTVEISKRFISADCMGYYITY
jgi:hypothetical protein